MKLTITKEIYEEALENFKDFTLKNIEYSYIKLMTHDAVAIVLKLNGAVKVEVFNDWVEIDGVGYDLDQNGKNVVRLFNKDVDAIMFDKIPNNSNFMPIEIELTQFNTKKKEKYLN